MMYPVVFKFLVGAPYEIQGPSKKIGFMNKTTALHVHRAFQYISLGNLRTMTKFMTTTSVDWENTETKTSVSAGKRKLKMRSVSRSTTTMTKCKHKFKTVMFVRNKVFRNGVFYNNARSYFLSRTSNFIDDEEFFVLSHLFLTFSSGKTPAFRTKIIPLST